MLSVRVTYVKLHFVRRSSLNYVCISMEDEVVMNGGLHNSSMLKVHTLLPCTAFNFVCGLIKETRWIKSFFNKQKIFYYLQTGLFPPHLEVCGKVCHGMMILYHTVSML